MSPGVNKQERTIAIVLGASSFPRNGLWEPRKTFLRSASKVKQYLTSSDGLGIVPNDLLDLFDDPYSPMEQRDRIEEFLVRSSEMPTPPQNLLLYYVGHGCFTDDQRFGFALQCTKRDAYNSSTLLGRELAGLLRHHAPFLRRFLVLDCCFAAQLYGEFLSTPGQALAVQIEDELPATEGTALLCASSKDAPAKAREEWDYTMFGGAFLRALQTGHPALGPWMSLRDIERLCRQIIRAEHPDDFVRPELHTPSAEHGDVASLPLFPNPAWAEMKAEQERRAAEQERLAAEQERLAVAERKRLAAEQERLAAAERKRLVAEQPRRPEGKPGGYVPVKHAAGPAFQGEASHIANEEQAGHVRKGSRAPLAQTPSEAQPEEAAGLKTQLGGAPRKRQTRKKQFPVTAQPTDRSFNLGGYAQTLLHTSAQSPDKSGKSQESRGFLLGALYSAGAGAVLFFGVSLVHTTVLRIVVSAICIAVIGALSIPAVRLTRSQVYAFIWWVPFLGGWYGSYLDSWHGWHSWLTLSSGAARPSIAYPLVAAVLLALAILSS